MVFDGQKKFWTVWGITERHCTRLLSRAPTAETIAHTAKRFACFIVKSSTHAGMVSGRKPRFKTQTSFKGKLESGLIKELVVGLAGPKGAHTFHCLVQVNAATI